MEESSNEKSNSELATKQEELQTSIDGVSTRLDKITKILSNAIVVEDEDQMSNEDSPAVTIKLSRSDADNLKDEVAKLSVIVKDSLTGIANINKRIAANEAKHAADTHKLTTINNDLDQHYRLHNAIFHNIRVPPINYDKSGKQISHPGDNAKFCQYIADQLNHYLPNLSIPVSMHNIDIAHPLRNNAKNQPVVIVRFVNRHLRNEILEKENKSILKSFGIGVTEQLTPRNMELFNKTKDIVGGPNVWSRNGKIFARTDKGKVHVTLDTILNNLTPPPPREDKTNTGTGAGSQSHKTPNNVSKSREKVPQSRAWGGFQVPPQTLHYGSQPPFMRGDIPPNQNHYGVGASYGAINRGQGYY